MPNDHLIEGINRQCIVVYFHELYNLALDVKEKCEKVFELTPEAQEPPNNVVAAIPELHRNIQSILTSAANIKKLIVTPSSKNKGENKKQFNLRKYRAQMLKDLTKDVTLKEILNHKVRNTLEHFDEYIDAAIVSLSSDEPPSPWAAFNMVVSSKDVFRPEIYPIKYYVANEKTFYNIKWSINIEELHNEASALVECIKVSGVLGTAEGPGAMILSLGNKNN